LDVDRPDAELAGKSGQIMQRRLAVLGAIGQEPCDLFCGFGRQHIGIGGRKWRVVVFGVVEKQHGGPWSAWMENMSGAKKCAPPYRKGGPGSPDRPISFGRARDQE